MTSRNKIQSGILYFLFVLFITETAFSTDDFSDTKEKTPQDIFKWRFKLQPFEKSDIYLNNYITVPEIIEKDNSLALMEIVLPLNIKEHEITIRKKGYCIYKKIIKANISANTNNPDVIILDPIKSNYRFFKYLKTGSQPKSVTFIDDDNIAVPLLNDNGVDIINIFSGKTKRLSPPKEWADKNGFVESVLIAKNSELWVSQMTADAVHVFDLKTMKHRETIPVGGKWGKVLQYNPVTDAVFLANWLGKNISIIDANIYRELYRFEAEGVPRGLMLSKDGKYLYIAQYGKEKDTDRKGRIAKYSFDLRKIVSFIGETGAQRHIINADKKGKYYVSVMSNAVVSAYNAADDCLVKNIGVYSHPNTIALSPDQSILYVSCRGRNNPEEGYLNKGPDMGRIYIISTSNDEILEYREGGNQPTGLDVSPDGVYLASSDFLDNVVRIFKKIK